MAPGVRLLALTCALLLGLAAGADAFPAGSDRAREAFDLCQQADVEQVEASRVRMLTRGLALAEAAVGENDGDALGHFALFCNLARRLRHDGLRLGSPFGVWRALRALDRAVALAPLDPDVMTARGALLIELPPLLGGDAEEGEAWLRRALAIAPDHATARAYLAALPAPEADVRRASR
jgi:hypothetical protein